MRKSFRVAVGVGVALCAGVVCGQAAEATAVASGEPVVSLKVGQVVPLRMLDMLSSTESTPGQVLRLEVAADVVYSGHLVMRKGDAATAIVTRAEKHHKRGQGGRVSMVLHDVTLADGSDLVLDTKVAKGGGGIGAKKYKALVITSLVLLSPAGTAVSLLTHGEEIVLPVGTYVEADIAADQTLDAGRFPVAAESPVAGPAAGAGVKEESLALTTSVGDGSVRVKGAYMGEAPLTMLLKPGTYLVRVDRDGYREWKQIVVVDSALGGPLSLDVRMVKR